ncbi:MAG: thioredoxin-disulfide reductase [Puniceicoccales bacterium]|jgi:thioredoxin reductase (NADPH)|nr:thioredoxin-disulfide reductase [Puniceicoccales bacterium]
MSKNFERVVIVGSGCAGLSAAIYTARAQLNPLVIQGEMPGGLLTQTTEVENFPGFSENVQGTDLMDRMRTQAEKFSARFENAKLVRVERTKENVNHLFLSNSKELQAQALIVATGSRHNFLGLEGEQELLGKGLSVCATCDGFFYRNEDVCVIGGGDSACEEALYLSRICKKVYLVHRRDRLRASRIMSERVCSHDRIEVIWNGVPQGFECDEHGFLKALNVFHKGTQSVQKLMCRGIFLAIGWKPNTEVFEGFIDLETDGYIKQGRITVETSLPGVFAAGDCTDKKYRQACVAAGMGIQAALEAESWLSHH